LAASGWEEEKQIPFGNDKLENKGNRMALTQSFQRHCPSRIRVSTKEK